MSIIIITEPSENRGQIKKAIMTSENVFVLKVVLDGETHVIQVDFSNAIYGIAYRNTNTVTHNNYVRRYSHDDIHGREETRITFGHVSDGGSVIKIVESNTPTTFPSLLYAYEGETTDLNLIPTITTIFPPPETFDQFKERVQPRVTQIANRLVMGLPHNLVHFGAKSA